MESGGKPSLKRVIRINIHFEEERLMRELSRVCIALVIACAFLAGQAFAGEAKDKASGNQRTVIYSFLGAVTGMDAGEKTITINAVADREDYLTEGDMPFREFSAEGKEITLDISKVMFLGVEDIKGIKALQLVRVGYDKKGEVHVAHTVLVLSKR
ncbi:MAG: hypothetical protein HPY65_04360 [Syntrophaceae bacterium]|nr:hypothetical protein [Syntrophaceae bacterium]